VAGSDGELVRRAGKGDERAWNELVERHSPLLWRVARAAGADHATASDIVQTTWLRLLDRLDTIRDPDKVRGWLAVTARNATMTTHRRSAKVVLSDDDLFDVIDDGAGPERTAVAQDDASHLGEAMGRISSSCRELLSLLFSDDDLSYAEISELTGRPIGAIGPTRQRCLAALRSEMELA
jgi:RNA polymerase sigma factor (sigma-70 family)